LIKKIICICLTVFILCNLCSGSSIIAKEELLIENSAYVTLNNNCRVFQTNISKSGSCRLEIRNNKKPVTITSFGKNIYNGSYQNGYIRSDSKEELKSTNNKKYKTTKWIRVYPGQTLTISGSGVNRNVWQFKSADSKTYSIKNSSTVKIPYGVAWARVFFGFDANGNVQIEYGEVATSYEKYTESKISIPVVKDAIGLAQDSNLNWYILDTKKSYKKIGTLKSYNELTTFSVSGDDVGDVKIYYPKKVATKEDGVYGVRWSLTELNEKCERLGAAVGLTASAVEGNLPVANDFDYIYPWSEIKLCNIDAKEKITYQGQKGFAFDGSNGNVFVELPKWYVKRYQDATHEYLYISKTKKEGFEVEPAFVEGNQVLDKIYIAAYDGFVTKDNKLVSWSGKYPTTNLNLTTYRDYARNNGSMRYGVLDIRCIFALQHLYLVEFANKNSSKTIGMGLQKMQYPFIKYAAISEKKSNRIILAKNASFKVGQSCSISEKGNYYMDHRKITAIESYDDKNIAIYFSGEPYDVNASTTYIYNTPMASGMCDTMTSPSGYALGALNGNGYTSVRYRFVENPWGNIWNIIDGAFVKNFVPYVCFDMTKYVSAGSEDYLPLNYTVPEQMENENRESYVNQMIKNLGYDERYPTIAFPVEISNGANKDNSFADSWYCINSTKPKDIRWKGAWDLGTGIADRAGLFMLRAWFDIDHTYWHDGARLMYKPIKLDSSN
jgi:hypothetical protein